VDERAFRQQLLEQVAHPCAFGKAVLSTCVHCHQAARVQIAEREVIACHSAPSRQRCTELHALLRHNFGFALHVTRDDVPIPHGQEMRVQCGGLKGLNVLVTGSETVADADDLLERSLQRWGTLDALPYSAIVQAARCYKGRHG